MKFLVLYDITSDPLRTELAELCKDFGLKRVQYSCFAGDLTRNRLDMLKLELRVRLRRDDAVATDSVLVVPTCDSCSGQRWRLGPEKVFPDRTKPRYAVV